MAQDSFDEYTTKLQCSMSLLLYAECVRLWHTTHLYPYCYSTVLQYSIIARYTTTTTSALVVQMYVAVYSLCGHISLVADSHNM